MTIKEVMAMKRIKQVEIAKELKILPCRVSRFINGIIPIPKKFHSKLSELLGIPIEEFSSSTEGVIEK